jgi:hypothetical protein
MLHTPLANTPFIASSCSYICLKTTYVLLSFSVYLHRDSNEPEMDECSDEVTVRAGEE